VKPRFMRRLLPFLALGSLPTAGCTGGTETGNPSFTGALSYTGYDSEPSVATVDNAWLSLGRVSFSTLGGCELGGGTSFDVPALGVGDHAAGAHNFTSFKTTVGSYCNVELPFVRVTETSALGAAPAELVQHSVLLIGHTPDGTPFRVLSAVPLTVVLNISAPFELADAEGKLLFVFDFSQWLKDVDFASAAQTDGSIEISDEQNSDLLEQLEDSLPRGVLLYRDADGDGVLDAGATPLGRGE
jgi:hypothetical protein